MEITKVEATPLTYDPGKVVRRSDLGLRRYAHHCIVTVETDEDVVGVGEVVMTNPLVVKTVIENSIGPRLIGRDPTQIQRLQEEMSAGYTRFLYQFRREQGAIVRYPGPIKTACISGIDIALWDILGQVLKQPVYKLLGAGGMRTKCIAYASGGNWKTPKEMAEEAKLAIGMGFRQMKIRFGMGPKIDEKRIKACRDIVGDECDIMVDVHGSQDVPTMLSHYASIFEKYDIYWIEEPVAYDDVNGHVTLKQRLNTRIAVGESLHTRFQFLPFLEARACDVVQPDPGNTGGLTEAYRIAELASAFNVSCAPHIVGTGVNHVASLHLCCAIPNFLTYEFHPLHTSPTRGLFLKEPLKLTSDGYVEIPKGPGLGVKFNKEETVKKYPYMMKPEWIPWGSEEEYPRRW